VGSKAQWSEGGKGRIDVTTFLGPLSLGAHEPSGPQANTLRGVGAKEQRALIEIAHRERQTRRGHSDSLSFFGSEFNDEGLSILAGLRPDLKALYLMGTKVGEEGLTAISYFHHLETLHMDQTPVTNRGIMRLAALSELKDISINQTEVGDAALTALITLPLQHFSARGTEITDGAASVWSCWPDLQSAYLNNTYAGDATAKTLAGLPNLEAVGLIKTWLTDAGLIALSRTRLKFLFVSDTEVTDKGVAALADHPTLEALSLDNCAITDQSIETILTMLNLEYLEVAGTQITDMGLLISMPRFGT